MFDERIVETLDRRYAFVSKIPDEVVFLHEMCSFAQWLFSADLIRPYALEILNDDERHMDDFRKHRIRAIGEAAKLRDALIALYPEATKAMKESTGGVFSDEYSYSVQNVGRMLSLWTKQRCAEEDYFLDKDPMKDCSLVGKIIKVLSDCEKHLRGADTADSKRLLLERIGILANKHRFAFGEISRQLFVSPSRSLRTVLLHCRAMNPPPRGTQDWMPFFVTNEWEPYFYQINHGKNDVNRKMIISDCRFNLERFYETVRALLGASLSSRELIARFKERCRWYDVSTMQQLVKIGKGKPEDRLTLALARYLHDNGIFTLLRTRMENLEPDAIAPGKRRFVIESKLYKDNSGAKSSLMKGFYQLHAYMTSLETKRFYSNEGFLVLFRSNGAIVNTDPTVDVGRFRIHIVTIDIGDSKVSGSRQPQPLHVPTKNLIAVLRLAKEPTDREAAAMAGN